MDFFYESQSLPEAITQTVTPAGKLRNEHERTPPSTSTFQRTVLVGMVLTAEQAESIGRWLQEKAREVHERTVEERGGSDSERNIPATH